MILLKEWFEDFGHLRIQICSELSEESNLSYLNRVAKLYNNQRLPKGQDSKSFLRCLSLNYLTQENRVYSENNGWKVLSKAIRCD